MKSILPTNKGICFICDKEGPTEVHHIFGGWANRRLSEKYGLKINICQDCHRIITDEKDKGLVNAVHVIGQKAFEKKHGSRKDFVRIFGKNYINTCDDMKDCNLCDGGRLNNCPYDD